MARRYATYKPGEKAAEPGAYYCPLCARAGIDSTCEVAQGQVFVACPRCLERKVAEWDLTWRPSADRSTAARRIPTFWPGSLGREG